MSGGEMGDASEVAVNDAGEGTTSDATRALDIESARLLDAARIAQFRAHAPYSRYKVGAAVLDEQGRVHIGCNVENAAYPQGQCAEAGAIGAMVVAGGTRVVAVALVGGRDAADANVASIASDTPVTPCGGCRQKLREFAAPDAPIYAGDHERLLAVWTLGQLLPESFGPEQLA